MISSSVTRIKDGAFTSCNGLTSIIIPSSVTQIGVTAFAFCSNLRSVSLPSSITYIGNGVFNGCGLTNIDIPASVTSIHDFAFSGCKDLTSLIIPSSVTSIREGAFRDCDNLKSIVIPSSVTSIGNSAFAGCSESVDVYCHWETPLNVFFGLFGYAHTLQSCTLHVPEGRTEVYRTAEVWKDFGNIVDDVQTNIGTIENEGLNENLRLTTGGIILTGNDWSVYTTGGAPVASGQGAQEVRLPAGLYIIRCNGQAKTVQIK